MKKKKKKKKKNTACYYNRPRSETQNFVYTTSEDPAEPSLYTKVYDIGTGRSETPLIAASLVVIYNVFNI